MVKVSRDARAILNKLGTMMTPYEPTMDDVFEAEQLAYSFYGKTVVGHIGRMFNPNSKGDPMRVAFYVKPTRSLNKGRRNKEDWFMTDEEKRVYWLICNSYLIEDFNYEALQHLRVMCTKQYDDVQEAIKISTSEQVLSIPYLFRVLEGIEARREHQRRQIEDRRKLFLAEQDKPTIQRNRIEMASLMHDWQETIQNLELQKKVDSLRRNS